MSGATSGLLCQSATTMNIQLSVLVQYKVEIIIISTNVTYSFYDIVVKLLILALNINHSLTVKYIYSLLSMELQTA